jgi:hypothetical protein
MMLQGYTLWEPSLFVYNYLDVHFYLIIYKRKLIVFNLLIVIIIIIIIFIKD